MMRHASARSRTAGAQSAAAYYEWKVQGHPLSIRLSFEVIDRLEADVMKGFWAVPKRGAEVGGVLFGRVDVERSTVFIDDYETVECEYRRGPSWVLSENDRKRMERTLRKAAEERQVVGFYRSHTRLGLYLDQDDYSLLQQYFPNENQVCLLIRPHASKSSAGGFFIWEEGSMHRQSTYLEFPFSTAEIQKSGAYAQVEAAPDSAPITHERIPMPEPPAERQASEPAPVIARSIASERRRSLPTAPRVPSFPQVTGIAGPLLAKLRQASRKPAVLAAVVLLSIGIIEYQVLRVAAERRVAHARSANAPALVVERSGPYLRVSWDRTAAPVANAERGVLLITDGENRRELQLDAKQLQTGTVAYAPSNADVSFQLDLIGTKVTESQSLRVVEGAPRPVQVQPARAARPAPSTTEEEVVAKRPSPAQPQPTRRAAVRSAHQRAFVDDGL